MPPQNILISLRCAPLHQDILHRDLTNGSIQFILKKERERPISRSHHKVIFLQLIVFTEIFSQSQVKIVLAPTEQARAELDSLAGDYVSITNMLSNTGSNDLPLPYLGRYCQKKSVDTSSTDFFYFIAHFRKKLGLNSRLNVVMNCFE